MGDLDLNNKEFLYVQELINKTSCSVFMTGRAGTGKSTFLRYIVEKTHKNTVVLAPTGIAAVNVKGQTLHSFFHIPLSPYVIGDSGFDTVRKVKERLKYNSDHLKLLQQVDLIVIDEISMVRADVLDFVDLALRCHVNPRYPFGGKQLLLVGDSYQLEPVVTGNEWDILRRVYQNPYFFSAQVFGKVSLVPIELQKVYRQNDVDFLAMLDRFRVGQITQEDLDRVNRQVRPVENKDDDKMVITLSTTRAIADGINNDRLEAIDDEEVVYEGCVEGDFPEQNYPTLLKLSLKKGAQVVFVRNDTEKRFYNGTIGKVVETKSDGVYVQKDDDLDGSDRIFVEFTEWNNIKYKFNEELNRVEEEVIGSFKQIPLKLAWAITIHKSQGLTFKNVRIDLGRGAFACGQTYVALSRCTNLEGIEITQPIRRSDVRVNGYVRQYVATANNEQVINSQLKSAESVYYWKEALSALRQTDAARMVKSGVKAILLDPKVLEKESVVRLLTRRLKKIERLSSEIDHLLQERREHDDYVKSIADEFFVMAEECLKEYGDDKAFEKNINKAIGLYPTHRDALLARARYLSRRGEEQRALEDIDVALAYNREDLALMYEKAEILMDVQRFSDAIDVVQAALRLDPDNVEFNQLYDELRDYM